jgi:hypothetical protein
VPIGNFVDAAEKVFTINGINVTDNDNNTITEKGLDTAQTYVTSLFCLSMSACLSVYTFFSVYVSGRLSV